jgi:hypothetical protein
LETQVSIETVARLRRHLNTLGEHERIALALYTRGGDTNTPWPLINAIRANCEKVTILVPYVAHSAGTLLTLGGDEILMTKYSTLSPIDPTVANAFNPMDPVAQGNRLPIAVEDVMAFLELAEKSGGESAKADAFRRLAESVHPLALGNVQRSINQIRQLAEKMLRRAGSQAPADQIEAMIDRLTTQSYSHAHQFTRDEAMAIGLPVGTTTPELEGLMLEYYEALCSDLELLSPWDAPALLRNNPSTPAVGVRLERAYIETATTCDAFVTKGTVSVQTIPAQAVPPGFPVGPAQQAVSFEITSEQWELMA